LGDGSVVECHQAPGAITVVVVEGGLSMEAPQGPRLWMGGPGGPISCGQVVEKGQSSNPEGSKRRGAGPREGDEEGRLGPTPPRRAPKQCPFRAVAGSSKAKGSSSDGWRGCPRWTRCVPAIALGVEPPVGQSERPWCCMGTVAGSVNSGGHWRRVGRRCWCSSSCAGTGVARAEQR